MREKLHNRRGETLTETLVAVLLIALSAAALAGMTASSARVTGRAEEKMQGVYDERSAAERGAPAGTPGRTVKIQGGTGGEESVTVYFSGEANGLLAYGTEASEG